MFAKLRQKSRNPSVNPYVRMMDPDIGTPDAFYMMDEIGKVQVLRRFVKPLDKSDRQAMLTPSYCGTFEILFKTERLGRFCLIMRRRPDEWRVPPEFEIQDKQELETMIIAEYYPDVLCRIYMRGLPEETAKSVAEEYITRRNRRRGFRRLMAPAISGP